MIRALCLSHQKDNRSSFSFLPLFLLLSRPWDLRCRDKMKFLLLFLVSLVYAYDIGKILQEFPKCALDCVTAGSKEVGCGVLDLTCECSKFEQLTKIVTPCLVHAGCKLEEVTR